MKVKSIKNCIDIILEKINTTPDSIIIKESRDLIGTLTDLSNELERQNKKNKDMRKIALKTRIRAFTEKGGIINYDKLIVFLKIPEQEKLKIKKILSTSEEGIRFFRVDDFDKITF